MTLKANPLAASRPSAAVASNDGLEMYAQYRARLRALAASEMPEQEFQEALKAFAREFRRDIEELDSGDRDLLCEDLGFQLENELYRAGEDRERRALGALPKVIDFQK